MTNGDSVRERPHRCPIGSSYDERSPGTPGRLPAGGAYGWLTLGAMPRRGTRRLLPLGLFAVCCSCAPLQPELGENSLGCFEVDASAAGVGGAVMTQGCYCKSGGTQPLRVDGSIVFDFDSCTITLEKGDSNANP